MQAVSQGRYQARLAQDQSDLDRARALRHLVFHHARGLPQTTPELDRFDAICRHILVEDRTSGALVAGFRVLQMAADQMPDSYSGQSYDLRPLRDFSGPMLEVGRFCLHPDWHDPDILRLAWGAVARLVDAAGVTLLFGCASFDGADPVRHAGPLRLLGDRHLGPEALRPLPKAAQTVPLTAGTIHDPRASFQAIPPLLRTYLGMGGWVSDHAVIDADLDTLHVFCAVEIARIPPARARALRLIAQG